MKYLRVIDQIGNKQDVEAELVPRIGDRVSLEFGRGGEPVRPHYYRVKDVEYRFDNPIEHQVAILIDEEPDAVPWPG